MPSLPGFTPTESQLRGLKTFWDNPTKYRPIANRNNKHAATRVFLDAIAAIEVNGSSREYFEKLSTRDPRAFISFLGKTVARLVPADAGLELEAKRVYRSVEEIRDDLRQKGIPVPESLFEASASRVIDGDLERERLVAEKRDLEARLRASEEECERLRVPGLTPTIEQVAKRGSANLPPPAPTSKGRSVINVRSLFLEEERSNPPPTYLEKHNDCNWLRDNGRRTVR